MRDLNDKITGDTLTAAEWNEVPSEIQNVIEGLGITLSSGDLDQLGKAIAGYVANGNFYTDSGVADAYVLTQIGLKQSATEYTDGMAVEFIAGNTNTSASTVNVSGLGVKNISNTSVASAIVSSARYILKYNSSSGEFDIVGGIGIGQTWQNLTGSRALTTVYTNTTGRSITVMVSLKAGTDVQVEMKFEIDGTIVIANKSFPDSSRTGRASVTTVIPHGSTYEATFSTSETLDIWMELR